MRWAGRVAEDGDNTTTTTNNNANNNKGGPCRRRWDPRRPAAEGACGRLGWEGASKGPSRDSEGGMMRLEILVELKFLNSSFSGLYSYRNYIKHSLSSNLRQQYLSQQYPPPLSKISLRTSRVPLQPVDF